MSQSKPANLPLVLGPLAQVDVDAVVTVRTGIQQNLPGGWSNMIKYWVFYLKDILKTLASALLAGFWLEKGSMYLTTTKHNTSSKIIKTQYGVELSPCY